MYLYRPFILGENDDDNHRILGGRRWDVYGTLVVYARTCLPKMEKLLTLDSSCDAEIAYDEFSRHIERACAGLHAT
jgi:hypothetical protein